MIILIALIIIIITRLNFLYFSKELQNIVSVICGIFFISALAYLLIKTNIYRLAAPYTHQHELDERETMVQLTAFRKSYAIIDIFASFSMALVVLKDELDVKFGLGFVVLIYFFVRFLPILIVAWTEEEI